MDCKDSAKFGAHGAMSSSARYMALWPEHYNVNSEQVLLHTPLTFFTLALLFSGRLLNFTFISEMGQGKAQLLIFLQGITTAIFSAYDVHH